MWVKSYIGRSWRNIPHSASNRGQAFRVWDCECYGLVSTVEAEAQHKSANAQLRAQATGIKNPFTDGSGRQVAGSAGPSVRMESTGSHRGRQNREIPCRMPFVACRELSI